MGRAEPALITRRRALQGGVALAAALALPERVLAEAIAPSLIRSRPSLRPGGAPRIGPYRVLAGSLHDHTTDSDGDTASERIAAFLHNYRQDLGIDYCALTDHSDFFPLAYQRDTDAAQAGQPAVVPVPDIWHRQAALAKQYRGEDFSLLRGFEWTNDQENHLNVHFSQNWTSRLGTGDASLRMEPFWDWLNTAPVTDPTGSGLGIGGADGIGIFNHPGDKGALNWDDYGLQKGAAEKMALIEIHGSYGREGRLDSDAGWYWFALSRGWHVSPVMDWDWHMWTADGVMGNTTPGAGYDEGHTFLPGQRSLVLAQNSLPGSIKAALAARRTSATEIPDLWATLRGPGGTWQGGYIQAGPGEKVRLRVDAGSPTEPLQGVEIISDNGLNGSAHYFGDNPDWAANHSQLTISYIEQHRRYIVNGTATRKRLDGGRRHDGPPAGTVVGSAPLTGTRASATIDVTVPRGPSPRPDGRHFFYAIVYAGKSSFPARAWTGPLLTNPHPGAHPDASRSTPAAAPGGLQAPPPPRFAPRPAPLPVPSLARPCGCRL
ncbi:MAG TPA: hypothetical protein VNV65_10615 [Candidatus Solibacter sp.]|jgi:hypothetical protein|nr:hypothetical protein [Candidatus Solibacter sp.]